MYPKVKVKAQTDEGEKYAYEKVSLQSLKAYGWLSPHHFSSSDASNARVPSSYVPLSPPPTFCTSKEGTHKEKGAPGKGQGSVRAASVPRPRAVISSRDNDGLYDSKTQIRTELLLGLRDHNQCQNRHTRCKIIPNSESDKCFAPVQRIKKQAAEPRKDISAKGRTVLADSSTGKTGLEST